VSALTGNDWNANSVAPAVELANSTPSEGFSFRQKMMVVRDTLVVLAMQLVFRTTMFLRHLNY
jgi:hypothetical protein